MKKLPIAVAAVAALAAGSALAQSNVNIYGRMNVSVERQKAGGTSTTVMQNNASRIGFRGTEDLGGGLKAGFVLEHGFEADTGSIQRDSYGNQRAFWARQSELNLSGGFGMVRLGRYTSEAYFATADYVSMHNHDTGTSADALYAYLDRDFNKIAYRTPDLNGLTVEGAVSLREGTGEYTYDVAANYSLGALALGAGYQKNGDANQFALRAMYTMGDFTFGGYIQRDEDGWGANLGDRTNVRLAGMYTLGASEFHLNVGRAGDYSDVDDSAATQFTVAYGYNLSKRTKAYAFYTKVSADSANPYTGDLSSFALGLRHNF